MKQIFTVTIVLISINSGWSQEATPQLKLKPRVADTTVQIFSKLISKPAFLSTNDSSHFSHFTSTGSVYVLPQDNMPWLKPNDALVENLPVKTDFGNGYIPNGYLLNKREALLQILRKKALE